MDSALSAILSAVQKTETAVEQNNKFFTTAFDAQDKQNALINSLVDVQKQTSVRYVTPKRGDTRVTLYPTVIGKINCSRSQFV